MEVRPVGSKFDVGVGGECLPLLLSASCGEGLGSWGGHNYGHVLLGCHGLTRGFHVHFEIMYITLTVAIVFVSDAPIFQIPSVPINFPILN